MLFCGSGKRLPYRDCAIGVERFFAFAQNDMVRAGCANVVAIVGGAIPYKVTTEIQCRGGVTSPTGVIRYTPKK